MIAMGDLRIMVAGAALLALAGCIPSGQGEYGWPGYQSAGKTAKQPKLETEDGILVDPPAPTWDGGDVVQRAKTVRGSRYVVRSGDTLRGIGNRTGAGSEAIARANGLEPPFTIRPGQTLIIPAGRYHEVTGGDTGIAIAQAYGVPWSEFIAVNGLEEPYILRIGQRLMVPETATIAAGEPSPLPGAMPRAQAQALEDRARAFNVGIDDIVTGSQPALAEGTRPSAPSKGPARTPSRTALAIPSTFGGRFVWPATGKLLTRFGQSAGGRVSDGIDIAAARGTEVRAAAPGVISYSGDEIGVFGGLVLISHGGGWVTAYGHLDRLDVVRGDQVRAGTVIGTVGDTGYVSQPQLHFQIRQDRRPVDPVVRLPKR